MRRFFVDTSAMLIFSAIGGIIIEIFVSEMTFAQSLQARFTAVPINLLTARPYGMFRDWLFKFLKAEQGGQLKKGAADTTAFILFQVPLYAAILISSGASLRQAAAACGTVALFSALIGRPYGIFLDFFLRLFKLKKNRKTPN